jgi:shikimate kinase
VTAHVLHNVQNVIDASPTVVAVVGPMGAGKSTVGALVAERLGVPLYESDAWLVARSGMTARQIAATEGVGVLHDLEATMVEELLDSDEDMVLTPAASVVERPAVRRRLGSETFAVFLDLPVASMPLRMSTGDHRRPVTPEDLEKLARRRTPLFAEAADVTFDATAPPDEIADAIVALVKRRTS